MGQRTLIVLDTHAWIWYATEDPLLSKRAKARIGRAEALGVHPVSCWEVAMLSNSGRLEMKVPVITRDQRITHWGQVETFW